ncbi:YopX family protein [Staphylococcus pseudintermedius]|nr:YopX family protein [Staphylococcus pseudintermedius]
MIPKFRAWDKTKNLILKVREISFFDQCVELENGEIKLFDEVALMHSTGLTDKYEDEVYIGDIIWDDMHEEYGVVKLSEAKAIIDWGYCFGLIRITETQFLWITVNYKRICVMAEN